MRSFGDEAMKIVYVQYEMPNRNRFAWSAVPAKDGSFVVPYYGTANRIARLESEDRRGRRISRAPSRHGRDPFRGAGAGRQHLADAAGLEQARTLGPADQGDRRISGHLSARQGRRHRGRRQAHGARRQPRPRVVHRHAAHDVRSEDRQIHAHHRRAARVRARARQGRQLLVRGEHPERKDRQGRRARR